MDFFEKNKLNGEEMINKANISILSISDSFIYIFVSIIIFVIVRSNQQWEGNIVLPLTLLSIILLIYGVVHLINVLITIKTTQLVVTNKRIIGKVGFLNTKTLESPINKITSISVESSIVGKILNYHNVKINVLGEMYNFKYVKNANELKKAIMNLQNNKKRPHSGK